jgi:CRISPR-associated protein Cas2
MEHLYVISYDIADDKRWRQVFRIMKGHGDWLQYSVFQCRLNWQRYAQLQAELNDVINHREDHVLLFDMGPVESVSPHVTSLGKRFELLKREALIF